jgi:hypothetical protein
VSSSYVVISESFPAVVADADPFGQGGRARARFGISADRGGTCHL